MKKLVLIGMAICLIVLFGATAVSAAETVDEPTAAVATPMITSCSAVDTGNRLMWTASPGAYMYRLFYKRADGGWSRIGDTTDTSYTHTGLTNNATYTYTVRAYDAYGTAVSSFDPQGVTATWHSVPQLGTVNNLYGGQRISWTPVEGAVNYQVYLKSENAWRSLGTTTQASFLYRGVSPGERCTYTVRCCTADGSRAESYFDRGGVAAVFYAAPEITGFAPAQGGIRITWSAVKGADRYRLFYKTETAWKTIATTDATSLTYTGLSDRTTLTYTVRALNSAGAFISGYHAGGWSYTYFDPPVSPEITFDGVYTARWERPEGVVGWQLWRRTPDGAWQLVLNTRKRTVYTDAAALPDVPYSYALRYVDARERPLCEMPSASPFYLNGERINGAIEWGGNVLHFDDGYLRRGFVTVDGRLYYYGSDGVMQKGGIVGSDSEGYTLADENGVCCISEEIRLAARFMMTHAEGETLDERMKTGYLYLSHQFPYQRTYDHPSRADEMAAMAIDMFTNERGNCYRYAACFACIARVAGYRARVVIGTTDGKAHGWVEVLVDGKWLICDPDADIPKYQNPDYHAYMMQEHYWQITPKVRCEITIDENGVAVWE